jgi:hypothetical protein
VAVSRANAGSLNEGRERLYFGFHRLVGEKAREKFSPVVTYPQRPYSGTAHLLNLKEKAVRTKSSLSSPQKRLLETMQKMNYGRIEDLSIRGGEPIFDPPPRIVRDVKLGAADNGARPELESGDFALKREHVELFESLCRLGDGMIDSIEVKAGLPFRLAIEERL